MLLKDSGFGKSDNYYTFARDYGDVDYHWEGVDFNLNARAAHGVNIQGGFTTGAGHKDICAVTAKLPELLGSQQISSCKVDEQWMWNWRGLIAYTVPKVDVQVSGILRFQANTAPGGDPGSNGGSLAANYNISTAQVQAILGRPLAGSAQNASINLLLPGQLYPERISTVDMRFAKILRIGKTRNSIGVDLYNLFNSNTGTAFNQAFGTNGSTWLRPTAVLNARFVRFNATVDF